MGEHSKIEWTNHTWNPWYGCHKVSEGCKNCYMYRDMKRTRFDPMVVTRAADPTFYAPIRKKVYKEAVAPNNKVFVCSWSDFFHPDADNWRDEVWDIIRDTPHLTYQILTKRPELIRERLPHDWGSLDRLGYHNVWLGVSVELQEQVSRIIELLNIPAETFWVSAEPLLGPLDLSGFMRRHITYDPSLGADPDKGSERNHYPHISWVVAGGESGPKCRVPEIDWLISLRDQCVAGEAAFFFKQWGGKKRDPDGSWGGCWLEGKLWREFPNE